MPYSKKQRAVVLAAVAADATRFKKDGTIEFRRHYFYTHGMTAESWAEKVLQQLLKAKLPATVVESGNNWQPWPKDSYFWVRVELED